MRSEIVTVGIVLLVIGIALYMFASMRIDEFQSFIGQVELLFSSEAYEQYRMFQLMQTMGATSAAAGGVLSIAGIAAKDKE